MKLKHQVCRVCGKQHIKGVTNFMASGTICVTCFYAELRQKRLTQTKSLLEVQV